MTEAEVLQDLARVRAQGDSKTLKRVVKDFYNLFNPELSNEHLHAAHEAFLLNLEQLTMQLSKTSRLKKVSDLEVLQYEQEAANIERNHAETQEKLATLRARLEIAQRDRARAIEYDALAKVITKLPDREQGHESIAKLREDITALQEEQWTYKATWAAREEQFGSVIKDLKDMSESIKEEKNEQVRKRALEDEDDNPSEEGPSLDPTADPFKPAGPALSGSRDDSEMEGGDDGGERSNTAETSGAEEPLMEGLELEEGQEREEKEEGEMEIV